MVVIDHIESTYAQHYGRGSEREQARGAVAAICGTTDAQTDRLIDTLLAGGATLESIAALPPAALVDLAP